MSKPHWFPFCANDFLASSKVALLSTEEIGAYILLLCHAWQDPQCSLPDDDEALSKLGRIKGDLTNIRECFTVKRNRLINERLHSEWVKSNKYKKLCSISGKQGADRRWPQRVTPPVTPPVTGTEHSSQSQSQSQLHKKDKKRSAPLRASVVDSDWLEQLGKNPAYLHINLIVEMGKMDAWLNLPRNAKRQKTRSFVLNWLNKVERPMTSVAVPKPKLQVAL